MEVIKNSFNSINFFRIQIFSDYQSEKEGFLCVGDIIWINYSEIDMSLIYEFKNV